MEGRPPKHVVHVLLHQARHAVQAEGANLELVLAAWDTDSCLPLVVSSNVELVVHSLQVHLGEELGAARFVHELVNVGQLDWWWNSGL